MVIINEATPILRSEKGAGSEMKGGLAVVAVSMIGGIRCCYCRWR